MKYSDKFLKALFLSLLFLSSALSIYPANSPAKFFGAAAFGNREAYLLNMETGDFNGDGKPDILTCNERNIFVFYGDGNGKFVDPQTIYTYNYFNGSIIFPYAGDFNNDGRSDIVMTRRNASNNLSLTVYLGNADKTFSAPVFSDVPADFYNIKVVDFDNDGKLDVVGGTDFSGSVLNFFKGNGNGAFVIGDSITTSSLTLFSVADFNNDNLPDVFYKENSGFKISVNAGNGHFGAPQTVTLNNAALSSLAVGDLNSDGFKDIVTVGNTFQNPGVTVWLGSANFTFSQSNTFPITSRDNVFIQKIVDLNNDNKLDLIFSSTNRTLVSKGLGNGTFSATSSYVDGGGGGLGIADLNLDGWKDIVANQCIEFGGLGSGSFSVLLNLQNGNFNSAPTLESGQGLTDLAISDFNNDGLKDFVVVNDHGSGSGDIIVVYQSAGSKFSEQLSIKQADSAGGLGISPYAVAVSDLNTDNKPDIVVVGHGESGETQNTLILLNQGNNNFTSSFFQSGSGDIYNLAVSDLDSNGTPDLVTTDTDGVSISYGNGNGTFAAPVKRSLAMPTSQIVISDFNNDSKADIAAVNFNTNKIGILINNGNRIFTNGATLTINIAPREIAAADMNSDGITDLVVSKGNGVSVLSGVGNGGFNTEITYPITTVTATNLAVADYNTDGKPDVALLGGTNSVAVLLNNGVGGLGSETLMSGGAVVASIAAGDLNNDQKPDLVFGFTTSHNGYTKLLFNLTEPPVVTRNGFYDFDGDGKTDISIFRPSAGEWWLSRSSTAQTIAAQFGASTDKLVPADFTGDGKTDIAIWRPSTGEWFILRSEDGSFFSFPFGTNGDIPVASDFDGDGKADPAVFRPSNSTWFISASSGGTRITTFGTAGDVPVASDYDGDGKSDIAIFRSGGAAGAEWWYVRSSDGQTRAATFGTSSDKAVQGDYTGDGKADIAFWRPSSGEWFILRSEDGSFFSFPFGASGDIAVPGDYDGDGRFDPAVFRPSSSTWFVNRTTAGILITNFGISGDRPIPNVFVP